MKGAVLFDGNISEYKVDLSTKSLISAKKVRLHLGEYLKIAFGVNQQDIIFKSRRKTV